MRVSRGFAWACFGAMLAIAHVRGAGSADVESGFSRMLPIAQLWPVTPPALLGEYEGETPCADCRAIALSVSFYVQNLFDTNSGTFRAVETYQATADGDRSYTSGGRWSTVSGVDFDRAGWIGQLQFDERGRTLCVQRTGPDTLMLLERDCRQPTARATPVLHQKSVRPVGQFVEVGTGEAAVTDAAQFAVVRRTKASGVAVSLNDILSAERREAPGPQFRLCLDVTDNGKRGNVLAVVVQDELGRYSLMLWEPARCQR